MELKLRHCIASSRSGWRTLQGQTDANNNMRNVARQLQGIKKGKVAKHFKLPPPHHVSQRLEDGASEPPSSSRRLEDVNSGSVEPNMHFVCKVNIFGAENATTDEPEQYALQDPIIQEHLIKQYPKAKPQKAMRRKMTNDVRLR